MFTFLLAEAELELVPSELHDAHGLQQRAKRRRRPVSQLLLDQASDHRAMRELAEGERRGRPDIAHMFLLLVLDSLLSKRAQARVLIHTRNDLLVRVKPELRIMRNQAKFYQLAEDLFRQGEAPLGAPLLSVERGRSAKSVVDELPGKRILLDVRGELSRSTRFAELARGSSDVSLVVGGFPRGPFKQVRPEWFDHVARVADAELTVWSALVPVIAGFEDALLEAAK